MKTIHFRPKCPQGHKKITNQVFIESCYCPDLVIAPAAGEAAGAVSPQQCRRRHRRGIALAGRDVPRSDLRRGRPGHPRGWVVCGSVVTDGAGIGSDSNSDLGAFRFLELVDRLIS